VLIKAVIFDYNGTLIDDRHLGYLCCKKTFKLFGLKCPSEDVYGREITQDFPSFYPKYGLTLEMASLEKLNEIRVQYYLKNWRKILLRPTSRSTVEYCRKNKIQTGIVSGERDILLRPKLEEWGMTGMFKYIKAESWPKTAYLLEAMKVLGTSPEQSVYVDDTIEGIEEAKSLGMKTVAMGSGFCPASQLDKAKPDIMIYEMYQLIAWLG
jgi:phosphoglycolate phosphatase